MTSSRITAERPARAAGQPGHYAHFRHWSPETADRYGIQCDPHKGSRGLRVRDWPVGVIHAVDVRLEHCTVRNHAVAAASASPLIMKLVVDGAAEIEQRGRRARLATGSVVLLDPDLPFTEVFLRPTRLAVFWLPRARLRDQCLSSRLSTLVLPDVTAVGTRALQAQLLSVLHHSCQGDARLRERMAGHLFDLMEVIAVPQRHRRGPEAALHVAKAHIARHLGDPELDAAAIGAALGLTPNYLNRAFLREGTTLMRWLWQQRLDTASRLLTDGDLRGLGVAEIAYRSGFSDAAHFSRRFRACYGTTPTEWRAGSLHVLDKSTACQEQDAGTARGGY